MREAQSINVSERQNFPNIFTEGRIGRFRTINRVKYASCSVSNYCTYDGFVTQRELSRDEVIAKTGAAILTNQGAYPDAIGLGKTYPRQLAIYDDRFIPSMRQITDLWRRTAPEGTILVAQILHGGRYGGFDLDYCWQPSPVPQKIGHFGKTPREMTKDNIAQSIEEHAKAAQRLVAAGFDGVEVAAFTGYILSNFNSKFTNKRTDEYGGPIENRGRFMVELLQALRKAIGQHLIMGVRLNGTEQLPEGNTDEECVELMKIAEDAGVDYISIVIAWHESDVGALGRQIPPDHWLYLLEGIKKKVKVPISFGPQLRDPITAEKTLAAGLMDYWELCRPFLADPYLVHKTAKNDVKAIKPCIGDLMCISKFAQYQPYLCTVNPLLGHEGEPEFYATPAVRKKKVMVIGGGPGGVEAALQALKRGHEVAIFEKGPRLGGQLLSAAGDINGGYNYMNLVNWYEEQVRRAGIEVYLNTEVPPDTIRKFAPDVAVLATGAKIEIPNIPGKNNGNVVSAFDVLQNKARVNGSRIAIIGGGKVGCAVALKLRHEGKQVTVIEGHPRLDWDVQQAFRFRNKLWFQEAKITDVFTRAEPIAITDGGVKIRFAKGEEKFIEADSIVLATRIQVNDLIDYLDLNVDELHIVGDAIKPRYIYTAIHEGFKTGCKV